MNLSSEDTDTTGSLDLLFSLLGEEFGLDDHGLFGEETLAQHLVETSGTAVDDGDSVLGGIGLGVLLTGLFRDEAPDTVEVDDGSPELVLSLVEVSHTDLTEVTRVVFVEVNSVVMLTTGITTTTRVLSVLADTTMAGGHVASLVSVLM